ncbi:MBL fold metallo-hydrolase [Saccharospirillum salsuginis]|uniref:MBL fold metallo-hydrolase n=1 Tax=Saccharospirillum salsuginis TaxID=418750 RepID=A0A918N7B7_9GAMM|nr:MBL fold metallo-hydrolase [Saccharospirillum salsuginis]GGX47144.1 MBL fold metallo-hydrolase [Saccharospirillum salsuginis]
MIRSIHGFGLSLLVGLALLGRLGAAPPPDGLRISLIKTAQSSGAAEALVVKGGRLFTERHLIHAALLVEHPDGRFLYDTGLGRTTNDAFADNRWWHRSLLDYEQLNPAVDQLREAGYTRDDIDFIIPSHLHWDHVGGPPDFPQTPVWAPQQALTEAEHGHRPAFLVEQINAAGDWTTLELTGPAYRGFGPSLDLFGDGRLILVDLSGHAHGQVGLFIHLDSGRDLFFIGDTSWTLRGVEQAQPRPKLVQWLAGVDADREQNLSVLQRIHRLSRDQPDLDIIPAHDEFVADTLARFPQFED